MPTPVDDLRCVWPSAAILGEGTCWSQRTQSLWWVDILGCTLHRWRGADGARDSWRFDEEISAVAERRGATGLIVTLRRGFALFDPDAPDAAPRCLHLPPEEPASNRFNDGKCDSSGRFWGGTMDVECQAPTGALYCWDAAGHCRRHTLDFAVTNGPTWSRDDRTLFVNDTVKGRVHAFDFDPATGSITNQRVWLRLARGDGLPDGMTTDAAGRLWIAHWGGACVSCHDPASGAELGRVRLPTAHVTNCTFGGADLRTLFITTARWGLTDAQLAAQPLAGGLFAIELSEAGLPAALFAG